MAHISLPPSETIGRAAAELVSAAGDDSPRIKAINKAQYHMLAGDLVIVPTVSGFLVPSGTRGGVIHRVSTVHGCDCEAGQRGRVCWHATAIALLEQAAKYTMPRIIQRPPAARPSYERAVAEVNELFAA